MLIFIICIFSFVQRDHIPFQYYEQISFFMNESDYEAAASIHTNHIFSGFSDTIHNQYYDPPQYSVFVVGLDL